MFKTQIDNITFICDEGSTFAEYHNNNYTLHSHFNFSGNSQNEFERAATKLYTSFINSESMLFLSKLNVKYHRLQYTQNEWLEILLNEVDEEIIIKESNYTYNWYLTFIFNEYSQILVRFEKTTDNRYLLTDFSILV